MSACLLLPSGYLKWIFLSLETSLGNPLESTLGWSSGQFLSYPSVLLLGLQVGVLMVGWSHFWVGVGEWLCLLEALLLGSLNGP